jgi:CRP-like cAMP-binding protein
MEHHVVDRNSAEDNSFAPVRDGSRDRSSSTGCALPLGIPMTCGDLRHREDLPPDTEVISGGEADHDIWLVRSGILRLQRYSVDGRRQILSLFLPGEIVGYDNRLRDGVSVETVIPSGLCRLDRRKFDTLFASNRVLRTDLLRQQQDQLDRLRWLTWSIGALNPEERLSAFLALSSRFMPYDPLPDGTGILSMQLPRADIADLLATTVETISRMTHRLSEAGLIRIIDPAHFRLLDLERLTSRGRIEAIFNRMSRTSLKLHDRLKALADPPPDTLVCFCGRQLPPLAVDGGQ